MEIDMSRFDIDSLQPPPPPSPPAPQSTSQPIHLPFEKVIVEPTIPVEAVSKPLLPHMSVRSYTIASLQQYTNSFSQDNYIGRGMLGSVYRAQLPNGKLLALKKLEKKVISQQTKEDFIEIVRNLYKIRHANVVEHMVSCSEHGQRILIYEYCSNGTLQDALHSDDGYKKKFSRNACIRMTLGTARALEYGFRYLHHFSEPPIIHRKFKSANVLLDEDLSVRVSDLRFSSVTLPWLSKSGKPSFTKKHADLFFPPDFADDFPVAMHISHKYSLIYVITKLGLLFVYDLETATVVYRNRISQDPIFLTSEASSVGGFYVVNRRGQVLLATVNESTIAPFVSGQLNNMEFAVNIAKRGNLPGAENLVIQRFQELFA
ncbi:putative protein kinase RLK-Pelle-LRR-V family [Helianthus anomalus]